MKETIVAILDDDEDILFSSQLFLNQYFEKIVCFNTPEKLLDSLHRIEIAVLLLDLNYGRDSSNGKEGLKVLETFKKNSPKTEIIVMTAFAEIEMAVKAIKMGAFDFISKPWQNERLLITIHNALKQQEIKNILIQKELQLIPTIDNIPPLIGESKQMQSIRSKVLDQANSLKPLLIEGEKGNGKTLVAQHIHKLSDRKEFPFITINLEEKNDQKRTLFDSTSSAPALWELGSNGTLFLQNIEKLDHTAQMKLIEEINLASKSAPRIICSTSNRSKINLHSGLTEWIKRNFITVPALYERAEDIPELVEYFSEYFSNHHKKTPPKLRCNDITAFKNCNLNIHDLTLKIERLIMMEVQSIDSKDLISKSLNNNQTTVTRSLEKIEKEHLIKVLELNKWNIKKTALDLEISRAALYRRIEKYRIRNEAL